MNLKFCEICEDFRDPELTRYFYDKREVTSPTLEFYVCWDCITNIIVEKVQIKQPTKPVKG
jgi:hypothetical protein